MIYWRSLKNIKRKLLILILNKNKRIKFNSFIARPKNSKKSKKLKIEMIMMMISHFFSSSILFKLMLFILEAFFISFIFLNVIIGLCYKTLRFSSILSVFFEITSYFCSSLLDDGFILFFNQLFAMLMELVFGAKIFLGFRLSIVCWCSWMELHWANLIMKYQRRFFLIQYDRVSVDYLSRIPFIW